MITVSVLRGPRAVSHYASWRGRDGEPIPDEIAEGLASYEFDTESEAAAFRKGLEAGAGHGQVVHLSAAQSEAIRAGLARAGRR